jgi:hypothetical protein
MGPLSLVLGGTSNLNITEEGESGVVDKHRSALLCGPFATTMARMTYLTPGLSRRRIGGKDWHDESEG